MSEQRHRHPGEASFSTDGDASRPGPAAGKVTRTGQIGAVQRSGPATPRPTPFENPPRDVAVPADPGEDPFATHLLGSQSAGMSEFLQSLEADDIVVSPSPLRLERGRPGSMTALPIAKAMLPADAAPVPLWFKLLGPDGRAADETGGHWRPSLSMGPALTLAIPGPGSYRLELHVNAGRPGYRILKRTLVVGSTSEEVVAADEGERMRAAVANSGADDDYPRPSLTTYRDMLATVLAAQRFTQAGDKKSYERAAHLLESVSARLRQIYPALLDRRDERNYSKNAIDRRFGLARDELAGWLNHLYLGSTIKTEHYVDAFQQARVEIKLGTGESVDLSDLQALDDAAITSAKVIGIAAAAAVAAPIAIEVLGVIGTEAAALQIGARLYTWAVANPHSAMFLAEYLAAMGIGILDQGGPENYFRQIQNNEDLAWAVLHTLMDLAEVRGGVSDGPGSRSRSRSDDVASEPVDTPSSKRMGSEPDASATNTEARRGKKANRPALETETSSLDGREFVNDIRRMSPQARHVVRQLEKRGWVRVDEIHPDDLVAISKWFGREIGVLQTPYRGKLRVVLGTRDGVLQNQLIPGEVFVVHTHPVMISKQSHFDLDLPNAGKHVEAVVDWSGQITYFSKTGIKNPVRPDGTIEPLLGYQAAFLNESGGIGGFAKIDIIDGPDGATVKVQE